MNLINKILFLLFIILLLFNRKVEAQNTPFIYYPLDSSSGISGNFADIRSHHFHSGIDFRTFSREGLPVYAVDSGYIARIFISPYGFGKALYIKHYNGYTSVYAHLRSFSDGIDNYVKKEQYKKESFSMDIILKKGELKVNVCDLIGYSGNSGSSEGPHLHFETRNSKTEKTIHPALLGYQMPDTIPPIIEFIKLYPSGSKSCINGTNKPITLKVETKKNITSLVKNDVLNVSGGFSIGINAYDKINKSAIKYDIHGFKVAIDTSLVFSCSADSFSFSDTRYVDTYIDYPEHAENKRDFIKTIISPNNGLEFYGIRKNNGIFNFTSEGIHQIKVSVFDTRGNEAVLSFKAMNNGKTCIPVIQEKKTQGKMCLPGRANVLSSATMKLEIPKNALFDSTYISYKEIPQKEYNYSSLYRIHDSNTPLFKKISLSIKPNNLPYKYRNKALIVKIGNKGEIIPVGGEWNKGYIKTSVISFGTYKIMLDTIPPSIWLRTDVNKIMHNGDNLEIIINDNLSGIDTYKPILNGKWAAMDYDAKNSLLVYPIKEGENLNENYFTITVSDKKGNTSCLEFEFIQD